MGSALDPSWGQRLPGLLRPDITRTVRARRIGAAALVLLAAAAALRPDPAGTYTDVAVAAADLRPGTALTADDVRIEKRSAATLPDGVQTNLTALIGSTLAGPARRGEVLTDARVLGPHLAGLNTGPGARMVPLHLTEDAVLDLVRPGDVVDILGAAEADTAARPRVLATGAVVVLVSTTGSRPGGSDRVVLVALPAGAAHTVAGASLVQSLTLTLH